MIRSTTSFVICGGGPGSTSSDTRPSSSRIESPSRTPSSFGPNPEHTLESFARVHPAHRGRGLGTSILSWFESRGRELAPAETTPALRVHGPHGDEGFRRLAGSRGFASARVFWHMSRDLSDVIEPSVFPPGVGVRAYQHQQDAGGVYDAIVESFAGHWGFERSTRAVHDEEMRHYDPDLVNLAVEGPTVVGLSIAKVADRWGWVDVLGVRPAWRGRGIARGLLLRSFAGLSRRGAGTVTLDVDSTNETGATHLYESVGMRVHRAWEIFEKALAAA